MQAYNMYDLAIRTSVSLKPLSEDHQTKFSGWQINKKFLQMPLDITITPIPKKQATYENVFTDNESLTYSLFVYLEELRCPEPRLLNLCKAKLNLTNRMITRTILNQKDYRTEDINTLIQQMRYTEILKIQLDQIRTMSDNKSWTNADGIMQ